MKKEKLKKISINILRDVLLALIVVAIMMGGLFAYCGIWPPVVVVESGSMMHGQDSELGIIDTGDMVLVKKSPDKDHVVTYVEGESRNIRTYGEYGNVIIYRPNGRDDLTPIIHRPMMLLEINTTHVQPVSGSKYDYDNYTFDVPELGIYSSNNDIVLQNYGYKERNVVVSTSAIINNFKRMELEPHGGYITMGDNNCPTYDQRQGSYLPVKEDWVVGRAMGELPWFGLIKLSMTGELVGEAPQNSWTNLSLAILVLVGIPLFLDFGLPLILKKDGENVEQGGEMEDEKEVPTPEGPMNYDGKPTGDDAGEGKHTRPGENAPVDSTDNLQKRIEKENEAVPEIKSGHGIKTNSDARAGNRVRPDSDIMQNPDNDTVPEERTGSGSVEKTTAEKRAKDDGTEPDSSQKI